MKHFAIGRAATAVDVNVETIRFYGRRGLIEPPRKPANGYRIPFAYLCVFMLRSRQNKTPEVFDALKAKEVAERS